MIIALFAVYPDLILENTTLMALPLYGYCNVITILFFLVPILVAIFQCQEPKINL